MRAPGGDGAGPTQPMTRRHTASSYAGELAGIREQLLLMGAKVEEMVASAVRAFTERDSRLAARVIARDRHIDRLELEIDERCLRVLARWKPVASDLRFVTGAFKLVTNLERVGDLAETICRRALELHQEPPMAPVSALGRLASTAPAMLREALDALVAGDAVRAVAVIESDRSLDTAYAQCFPELMCLMVDSADNVERATRLQSIAASFERIGDHATNIAELVVFMANGSDVRRGGVDRSLH